MAQTDRSPSAAPSATATAIAWISGLTLLATVIAVIVLALTGNLPRPGHRNRSRRGSRRRHRAGPHTHPALIASQRAAQQAREVQLMRGAVTLDGNRDRRRGPVRGRKE